MGQRRRWQRPLRSLRVAVAALTLAACGTVRTEPSAPAASAADIKAIDRLCAIYGRPGVPGAAIGVIRHGRLAFTRSYGLADLESGARVTERTNFRLASLSKAFTATAVMLLVNDGRLALDERVRDLIPDFPAYGRDIRVRHLLQHTSGLRAYEDFVPETSTRQLKDRDVVALLRRTDALMFPPGSAFRYNDSNYALLAVVVEVVSGQGFARFLHERVLAPLGMTASVVWEPGVSEVANRAFGYGPTRRGGFGLADHTSTSTVLGDGGVYSSVHDLAAWDRGLDEATLLGPRVQPLMWTPGSLDDGTPTRYGLGWFLDRTEHGLRASHRGESSGFTHAIVKDLDRGVTVILLTNRRGGAPDRIAAAVAALPSFR